MRFKKCECGQVIVFSDTDKIPVKCNCGRKLGSQIYSDRDIQTSNNREVCIQTKLYFEELVNGWWLDIPDNVSDFIVGRGGASFKEKPWSNTISRKHIQISNKNTYLVLIDYSLNGTRINGKIIKKNQAVKVVPEDVITLDAIKNEISFKLMERR